MQDSNMHDRLGPFAREVKQRLQDHSSFLLFLFGMRVFDQHDTSPALLRALPMLDLGNATTTAMKKSIAAYVGIPTGRNLKLIRRAWSFEELRRYADAVDGHLDDEDNSSTGSVYDYYSNESFVWRY